MLYIFTMIILLIFIPLSFLGWRVWKTDFDSKFTFKNLYDIRTDVRLITIIIGIILLWLMTKL